MSTESLGIPMLRTARKPGESLAESISAEPETLRNDLREHGAVLFRGFAAWTHLDDVVKAWGAAPLAYREAATPRTEIGGQVYTSTDYPRGEEIHLHNEACYADSWPGYLYFGCVCAADTRGGTTVADARRLLAALPPGLVDRFRGRGVTYVRSFHPRLGLPWQQVFGTDDPAEMLRICEKDGISAEWLGDGVLQTRQTRPALLRHPDTGEECWFNQAVAFHSASLPADLRATLTRLVGADAMPKQVRYGDGTEIAAETIAEIMTTARRLTVPVRWRPGDVLIVDNILVAHGREPYTGERRVLVAMSHERFWSALVQVQARGGK